MWVLTRQGKAESSFFSRVFTAEEHAVCLSVVPRKALLRDDFGDHYTHIGLQEAT